MHITNLPTTHVPLGEDLSTSPDNPSNNTQSITVEQDVTNKVVQVKL